MAKLMQNPNILVVKLQGQAELIYKFLSEVQKIVSADNIDVSSLLRNKGMPGHHLFFRIDFTSESIKKERNFDFKTTKTDSGDTE